MKKIKKTARDLKDMMVWSEELSPELAPAIKVAKVLNGLIESDMEINRENIEILLNEIVELNQSKEKENE